MTIEEAEAWLSARGFTAYKPDASSVRGWEPSSESVIRLVEDLQREEAKRMKVADDTKREIDADVEQAAAEKRDAEYAEKPCCGKCGHGPGEALHVCRNPDPVAPTPGIEAEREAEEMTPATLQDFLEIVDKHGSALMTPGDRIRYAKLMLGRHPMIERAYRAGLRQGRDLRECAKRGMGWFWPELEDLTPRERTFVLARVRDEVMGSH